MVIGSRQRLATHGNLDLDVFVDNKRIKRVSSSESLGLTIDENLNWSKLQKLQNRAARAIICASYDIRTNSLLEELKWNTLVINRKKHTAILMHKTIKKMKPQYLQEMFTFKEND